MLRVLLLIPTTTYRATDFLQAAQRLGVEVVVASDQEFVLGEPGRTLAVDLQRPDVGAAQIAQFADSYPLDAVVAVDDPGAVPAAAASARLRLSHNPVEAVRATRNKLLLRQRLAAAGLPSPQFRAAPIDADPRVPADAVRFPCVLKPLALSAGRGVIRADDAAEFAVAFARLGALLRDPKVAADCGDTAGTILIEDYIEGVEVSLEGLLDQGALHALALFDKPDPLVGPFFEETIYVTPSRLSAEAQRTIIEGAEGACRALGLRDGPVHAELRLNDRGAWPIDIAARTIGGLCSRTLSFGTGMSLEEIVLRHAIGAPIASLEREPSAAGVMMIPIPAAGTLRAVQGIEEAKTVAGIREVTIAIPIGRPVTPLPEGGEYLGFILAKGERPEQVEASLREAHRRLRFEVE